MKLLVFFIFSVICLLVFMAIDKIALYYSIRHLKRHVSVAQINCKLMECKYDFIKLKLSNGFIGMPNLYNLLKEYVHSTDTEYLDIDKVKFIKSKRDYEESIKILDELEIASSDVKKCFIEFSLTINNIYKLKHPIKYYMLELKKILLLQIIKLIVAFASAYKEYCKKRKSSDFPLSKKNISLFISDQILKSGSANEIKVIPERIMYQ